MPIKTTKTSDLTAAAKLSNNPVVQDSIDAIVRELIEVQSKLTAVRPPQAELTQTYEEYLQRITTTKGRPPLYPYVGSGIGNGALVELADGSVKWDMICGIGVHMFGHSDPDMVATGLRAALGDTVMQGNLQFNADSIEFGEMLVTEAARASRMKYCFLANSGVMANESALKICFQKNAPASRVIAFDNCFMGRSITMAQIGDSAAGRVGLPLQAQVDYVPFYDPELGQRSVQETVQQLQRHIARYPGQHACFIFELVQGEGGFNLAPREFFEPLMRICKENNIAVFVDEVQTFGRTNHMFHFEQLSLGNHIDVVTIGKMSQVCACLYTEEFNPKPGLLSGTFIGGTVGLQVGKRVLERLRDGGYYGPEGKIAKLQQAFRQHAKAFVEKHKNWFPPIIHADGLTHTNGFFGGVGGMMRLTPFAGDKARIIKALNEMFAEGVMRPEQFRDVFAIMETALARV